jgi:hypothetical protein
MRKQTIENLNIGLFAARFLEHCGHVDGTGKADAGETIVFGRELEHIIAATFDVKYAETSWRKFVPTDTVDPGTERVTYQQYDMVGEAEFVDLDSNAFPRVEIKGAEFSCKFASIGASYGYSIGEWRAAQLAKRPLDAMKARAVREIMERKLDKIAAVGDAAHNLTGLANAPNVTVLTNGAGGTVGLSLKVWLPTGGGITATALDIYNDVAFAVRKIRDDSKNVFQGPYTLLLPTKISNYLNSTLFQPTFNTKTVLQAIKEIDGISVIDTWNRLDAAGADLKGRIVLYTANPELVQMYMATDFESFPPEVKSRTFTVDCHARPGTVAVRYPKSMIYLDGCGGTDA